MWCRDIIIDSVLYACSLGIFTVAWEYLPRNEMFTRIRCLVKVGEVIDCDEDINMEVYITPV